MVSEKQNSSQDKLEKSSEALAEARKMQHDWMTHGLDFVDLYVEDVDRDWLERWGEDDEKNTKSQQLAAIRQTEIDAEFAEMTNDREYQEEALAICREFAIADWEAFQLGEAEYQGEALSIINESAVADSEADKISESEYETR